MDLPASKLLGLQGLVGYVKQRKKRVESITGMNLPYRIGYAKILVKFKMTMGKNLKTRWF